MECVKAGSCSAIRAGEGNVHSWGLKDGAGIYLEGRVVVEATLKASAPLRFFTSEDQPVKMMACDWTGRTKLKEKRYASQVLVTRMPFLPSWKTVHGILSNKANVFRQQSPLTF